MHRKIFNLERDLRSTEWIIHKVRGQEIYAQNLYAALCNNNFAPKDVWAILKNLTWNCSWSYAADMIADIRRDDSYIHWYCSGTGFSGTDFTGFVEESYVTDEIIADFDQIGWILITQRWYTVEE
jgi:hypothetical protein